MIYTDWLGQEIKIGSPVLYAISNDHFAKVVWAEVVEIIPIPEKRDREGAIVPPMYGRSFKLKVQPFFENTDLVSSGHSRSASWKWNPDGLSLYERVIPKQVMIQNVEKVTVFPLPEGVRERVEAKIQEDVSRTNARLAEAHRQRVQS